MARKHAPFLVAAIAAALLAGCGGMPPAPPAAPTAGVRASTPLPSPVQDVVLFAFGLIDTGYRFGGKNPEAGLDCSGMVSYIFGQAAGLRLTGSAADMVRLGRPVPRNDLRPGDLVFFNTLNRPHSHVGLYIGDDRFVHAPASNGRIRIDSLNARYFAERFETARSYFD